MLDELVAPDAQLSLAVLAYNFKRVFNMKGPAWMHLALRG